MRHLKIQLGLSASLLASLFALFAVAPRASADSGVDLTLYDPTLFAFCTVAIVIVWLDFIVMSDTPSHKLSATTKGKRELLQSRDERFRRKPSFRVGNTDTSGTPRGLWTGAAALRQQTKDAEETPNVQPRDLKRASPSPFSRERPTLVGGL